MNDLIVWSGSSILKKAEEARLTTTCLVPTAVFNCCWVEMDLISRNLALDKKALCIRFME
jgi:hypothetical protein